MCLLIETAAAEFMQPLFEDWLRDEPGFGWTVHAGPAAINVLSRTGTLDASRLNPIDANADEGVLADRMSADVSALVVSAATRQAEFSALRVARMTGKASLQIVDNWYGYRRRIWDGANLNAADRILVIDGNAKQEAAGEGLPVERIIPVGHPAWETAQHLPATASRDVLYLDAPVARDYGTSLGYTEDDSWTALQTARAERPDLFGTIYYAPHPTMQEREATSGVEMIRYRRELLELVGTVIGIFSAPLVEAFLAGRRTITLQPGEKVVDMCPLSRHGLIPRSASAADLIAALSRDAADPAILADTLRGSRARVMQQIEWALAA